MSRRRSSLLLLLLSPPGLLLLALLPVCGPWALPARAVAVHRPHKREAREQIEDLEQQWRTATLNADLPAMDRLLSDDYVGISWSGEVNTKAAQLDHLRTRAIAITRMDMSDLKVKLVGLVAIVTSRAEIEGINNGADMKGEFRYTRVYQRLPSGTWKITNFEATRIPRNGHHRGDPANQP